MLLLWRTKPLGEELSKESSLALASSQCPSKTRSTTTSTRWPWLGLQPWKGGYLEAEAIQDAQDVVVGMFPVKSYPTKVLFDIGATHSFVSTSSVEAHNIPIETMIPPLRVNSVGGKV
jgi:hypothetical protein